MTEPQQSAATRLAQLDWRWKSFDDLTSLEVYTMLGARSAVFYAFNKDGKPMFVQQKGSASIGWGDDGKLLVNEKRGGGEESQGEVDSMRDAAVKAGQMAQEKYDASKKK